MKNDFFNVGLSSISGIDVLISFDWLQTAIRALVTKVTANDSSSQPVNRRLVPIQIQPSLTLFPQLEIQPKRRPSHQPHGRFGQQKEQVFLDPCSD